MSAVNAFADYKYEGNQLPMEEIKVLHLAIGTQIPAIRNATIKIFTPGLVENKEKIEHIQPVTETYGPHYRHVLDIYQAKNNDVGPILVFLYGGGMIRGDRILADTGKGLIYWNLGTFFASRGITTIIPDYRRVKSPSGSDGAVFPTGGEDVSLVLKWLETSSLLRNNKREVYLLGNSAGAIHASTFLFDPSFLQQRQGYFNSNKGYIQGAREYVTGGSGISLQGAVLLALPAHFEQVAKDRKEMLSEYYGNEIRVEDECPLGLLRGLSKHHSSPTEASIPKILALLGEYDPRDEIGKPMEDFVELYREQWPDYNGIEFETLKGHNHISPVVALMSGDEKGEQWGDRVVRWILGREEIEIPEEARTIKRGPSLKGRIDEDTSTIDAREHDKSKGKDVDGNPKLPTEDSTTKPKGKNVVRDVGADYSTEKQSKTKQDPTQDFSTDSKQTEIVKNKPSNPTTDYSTQAEDKRKQDPSEDDSGKELN